MTDGRSNDQSSDARPSILPTGTVSFLLTDVVGSTRIWETDPVGMADAIVRH